MSHFRVSLVALSACVCVAAPAARPNFLVLFPDQWRSDWTPDNAALHDVIRMPTFASLRARGTSFKKVRQLGEVTAACLC